MRRRGTWLIVLGAADIVVVLAAFALHSLAFASQYTGFLHWLVTRGSPVEAGSPEYESIRLGVLEMIGRTTNTFLVVAVLLVVNGVVLLTVGMRRRMQASQSA